MDLATSIALAPRSTSKERRGKADDKDNGKEEEGGGGGNLAIPSRAEGLESEEVTMVGEEGFGVLVCEVSESMGG